MRSDKYARGGPGQATQSERANERFRASAPEPVATAHAPSGLEAARGHGAARLHDLNRDLPHPIDPSLHAIAAHAKRADAGWSPREDQGRRARGAWPRKPAQ